jgi:acyl carrier protein
MSHKQFMIAVRPKLHRTWHLHNALGDDLDFFVMLSSSASMIGSRAQGNYAAGNAFQDALAVYRTSREQHASAIDLGIIFGVGFLEENTSSTVNAKCCHLRDVDPDNTKASLDEDWAQVQSLLRAAKSPDDAIDVVSDAIVNKLAKSMMVDVQDIEKRQTITKYGVDSLLAVELRSWIYTELQVDISIFELLKTVPILDLARQIAGKSKLLPAGLA